MDAYVPLGEVMFFRVALSNSTTSAPSDASGDVTWQIFEESTTAEVSSGTMTKNGTHTGLYWGEATLAGGSGYEVGKWYDLYVQATAGTAGHAVLHTFRISSAEATVGAINAFAQAGTVNTLLGTVSTVAMLLTGTVTTVTNAVSVTGTPAVNMVALNASAIGNPVGTNFPSDVRAMAAGVITSSQYVANALSPTAFSSAAVEKFVSAMATGTIGTALGTVSGNVVAILGTGAVATQGTFTNIGTVGTALGTVTASGTMTASTVLALATVTANVTQILGTTVVATSGTLTNVGTVGTALGTITASGTVTASTVLSLATVAANVVQVLGTTAVGTQGTFSVTVAALTASRATLGAITAPNAGPLDQLQLIYTVTMGTVTQDATRQSIANPGGTVIATAVVSGDTNTFTRGGFA